MELPANSGQRNRAMSVPRQIIEEGVGGIMKYDACTWGQVAAYCDSLQSKIKLCGHWCSGRSIESSAKGMKDTEIFLGETIIIRLEKSQG